MYEADREVESDDHRVILEETPGKVIFDGERTMAATASIDAFEWLRKQIEETAPDPLTCARRQGQLKETVTTLALPRLRRGRYHPHRQQTRARPATLPFGP